MKSAPVAPAGFASRRHRDPTYGTVLVKVLAGELYVASEPDELIVTVLGSCVAACMRDPVLGIGGMNHFMLPGDGNQRWSGVDLAMRHGTHAMETLVNELMKRGAVRGRLEAKLFGGGHVIGAGGDVGKRNAIFARRFLADEGIDCIAHDLGGLHARRVHYDPVTGRAQRRFLVTGEQRSVAADETRYQAHMVSAQTDEEGDVELFG